MKGSVIAVYASLAIVAAGASLAGCSQVSAPSLPGNAEESSLQRPTVISSERKEKPSPLLFVGNYQTSSSNVLVFADSGKVLKRTIALPNPIVTGVAVSAGGDLFAASGNYTRLQSISVFKSGSDEAIKTLQQRYELEALTVDPFGNLFASCGHAARRVCEFGAAKRGIVGSRIIRRMNLERYGIRGAALTTDASGDLAVSDQNHVTLFAPGSITPYLDMSLARWEIGTGGVAFDQSGNLYVAWTGYYDSNGISEYAPGSSKPAHTFYVYNDQAEAASVLRFDGAGNLYALFQSCNLCGPEPQIDVFAPNGTKPVRTITKGIENFKGYLSMAVDAAGDIFVANDDNQTTDGSIAVYAPGQAQPKRMITNGIDHPAFLAVTPGE